MRTISVEVDPRSPDPSIIERAADVLRRGGLVAFPTETVYGLGADALAPRAVMKIFAAKGRPSDNPLILHVSAPEQADPLARVDDRARRLMGAFWPGPLTLVLEALPVVPMETRGGLDTVALRMPDHPVASALIAATGSPLAAPSANTSGRPSPTDAHAVWDDLHGKIDMILDGGRVSVGIESTVIDVSGERPLLLRPGGLAREAVEELLGVTLATPDGQGERRSPGTRYRHYAPTIPVILWEGDGPLDPCVAPEAWGSIGVSEPPARFARALRFTSMEDYARGLFAGFREIEAAGLDGIVVELPPTDGLGLGLRDRILRAAQKGRATQ